MLYRRNNKIPESKMKTDEIVEKREKEIDLIGENNNIINKNKKNNIKPDRNSIKF